MPVRTCSTYEVQDQVILKCLSARDYIQLSVRPRFVRRFHIRFHAADTRIAKSLPLSGRIALFLDVNLTRLHPRIKAQFNVGRLVNLFNQSRRVRSHIKLWPCPSHPNAICSNVSGTSHVWHRPRTSSVSMWNQKSPTLNVLCIHFQKNSRVKRLRLVDSIDL
jgi:hypothetical protein